MGERDQPIDQLGELGDAHPTGQLQPVDDQGALRGSAGGTGFEGDLSMAGDHQTATSHRDPVVQQLAEFDPVRVEQLVDGAVDPDVGDRPDGGAAPERQQQPGEVFGQRLGIVE